MKIHKLIQKALQEEGVPTLTAKQAYQLILEDSHVILIDVRTQAERDWVGCVDIPKAQHLHVEWSFYPGSALNVDFIKVLNHLPKDTPLLFLCRSGVRSKMAAQKMLDEGFIYTINIQDGFEGPLDRHQHRKSISGWCYEQLPWIGA